MKRASKTALYLVAAFFACLLLFCGLKVASAAIPASSIHNNLSDSADQLLAEGAHYTLVPMEWAAEPEEAGASASSKLANVKPLRSTQLDNHSTASLLNMSAAGKSSDTLHKAFADYYYFNNELAGVPRESGIASLRYMLDHDIPEESKDWNSYARYWNGNVAVTKPLLLAFDLQGLRLLFLTVGILLLVACAWLGAKRVSVAWAAVLVLVFFGVGLPVALVSTTLAFCFLVALAGCVFVLANGSTRRPLHYWAVVFFVLGGLTAYLDFLCTPIVTCGMPLVVLVRLVAHDEGLSLRNLWLLALVAVGSWALGYGFLWLAKWVLSTVILGKDVVGRSLSQVFFRTGDALEQGGGPIPRVAAPALNLLFLALSPMMWPVLLLGLCTGVVSLRFRKELAPSNKRAVCAILAAGALPLLWYLLAANHSIIHYWFTYRSLAVTVLAVATVIEMLWVARSHPTRMPSASKR